MRAPSSVVTVSGGGACASSGVIRMSLMRSSTADRDAVEAEATRSVTKARTTGRRHFMPATVDESVDRGNGATSHDPDAGARIELHALEPAQMVGHDVPRRRARRLAET